MLSSITKTLTTLVVAAGSLLNTNLSPLFTNIEIKSIDDRVFCSAKLKNGFNEDLDKIFSSGHKIYLKYKFQIFNEKNEKPIKEKELTREIEYDVIDNTFVVKLNKNKEPKVMRKLSEAKRDLCSLKNIEIFNLNELKSGQKFFILIKAYLKSKSFHKTNKHFDLMLYWNNKPPTYKTDLLEVKSIQI